MNKTSVLYQEPEVRGSNMSQDSLSQQQVPCEGYKNNKQRTSPEGNINNPQETQSYTNYGCYGQQQGPFRDYQKNQFGVPLNIEGRYCGNHCDGQVMLGYPSNQFGYSSSHLNGDCCDRQQAPSENYYNTQGGVSLNTSHGYYGRGQQASDPGSYQYTGFANTTIASGGYYDGQQQSQSIANDSDLSQMQRDYDSYVAVERAATGGGLGQYEGEPDIYHHGWGAGAVHKNPRSVRPEQKVSIEQSSISQHTNNGSSAPTNDFRRLTENSSALTTSPISPPNSSLGFIEGPDIPQNNTSTLVGSPDCIKNTGYTLVSGTGRLQDGNSASVTSPDQPTNSNPAFINGPAHSMNSNGALIRVPRLPAPHPPRWRYEDTTIPTTPTPPPSSPLFEEPNIRKDEDGRNSYINPLTKIILKSLLRESTSFEKLARVDSISRTDLTRAYIPHCPYILKGRCQSALGGDKWCSDKVHFRRVVHAHTDVRLGDCSFLDSCDLADRCPYIHYAPEYPEIVRSHLDKFGKGCEELLGEGEAGMGRLADDVGPVRVKDKTKPDEKSLPNIQYPPSVNSPPQWIKCDVKQFDLKVLGKFGVVMADPPWDIRMTLPYGTVPDQAIIDLPFKNLQDEGVFFLWCTARAVDTGHACLKAWGYEFSDEIAWVKVDHLKRLISVGRTGHWLNHTMEHCLVGIKGNPEWIRKRCDTDVIVSQPRATSHKPDEIYELIERLVGPNTRKLEIFGREHNIRKGWLTIGNQLPNTYIHEEGLKENLARELSRKGHTRNYNSDWNPWAQGFTRYGYGKPNDWREERKLSTNRSNGRMRGRAARGSRVGDGGSRAQHTVPDQQGESASQQLQDNQQVNQQDTIRAKPYGKDHDNYKNPASPRVGGGFRNGAWNFHGDSKRLLRGVHSRSDLRSEDSTKREEKA